MPNHSADVGKLVEELIQKHQAEADDLALSEKVKYGDSSTVSTYTWVHSMKAMSQKFVRDLLDIQTVLDNVPTLSPDEVRGVGEWIEDAGGNYLVCPECKYDHALYDRLGYSCEHEYCPNCGKRLRMKGAEDSE